MDSSCFQFYKHMGGFFMHSISLPEKLTRKLEHLVGKLLELKGPTGTSWYVGLVKSGDKLVLQPGWNDFASANNISQNDNLVFKLVGGSKFEVFIFDPTGCEKSGMIEKEEEQEHDEGLGSIVGEELSDDVCIDVKEQDKQYEVKGETGSSLLDKKKSTDEEQVIRGETESSLLNKKNSSDEKQGEIRGETESSLLNKKKSTDEKQGEIRGKMESSLLNKKKSTDEELGNKGETGSSLLNKKESTDEKQGEIRCEKESSLLNKKKSTDGEQGGSEASNDSISLTELRKIMLYQKAEVRKSKIKTKMQHPSEIHGEIQSPLKRPRRNPSNNVKSKKKKGKSIKSCYNNYTARVPRNAEEGGRARQLSRKVQNGNPYFHKILTKWNLTHPYCLHIPTKFGVDHLKRENLEVILCCPGDEKTWYATSYFRSAKNYHTLSGSTWEKFVKEKNLKINDLCLFELDKTAKRLTFVVHTSQASNKFDS